MRREEPIYLDNAATTRPLPEVVEAMARVQLESYGNPSSSHAFARAPKEALEDAREFLRGTLSAARLIFTSGGTEADLLGVAGAVQDRPPGRVLAAATDHPAILAQKEILARTGHRLVLLPTTRDGDLEPELLFEHLGKDVRAIALLHGHNELGTLTELEELVSLVRRVCPNAHVHVDLVQSYGKIDFDLDAADVESVAVSAHKLHGPRGVGFLALSSKARISPLMAGGGQEEGLRGGTENVAAAVGLMLAAEAAISHMAETARHTAGLAARLYDRIVEAFPKTQRLGQEGRRLPHILSLRIPKVVASTLLEHVNEEGLAFSTGAACHGPTEGQNHVLEAIGMDKRSAREVMRFSFCRWTTAEEVDRAAEILIECAQHLERIAPRRERTKRS